LLRFHLPSREYMDTWSNTALTFSSLREAICFLKFASLD
jgi:hypothetical protein